MQAVLLATGEKEKLRPLTNAMPSPMLPIAGRPVMAYTLDLLARQELKQVVVSLYSLPGSIEGYFGTGSRWGMELNFAPQPNTWGSAGSLWWVKHQLSDTFIVIPADALIDFDLAAAFEHHITRKNVATIVVHSNHGSMASASRNEKASSNGGSHIYSSNNYVETGIYLFDRKALDYIPPRTTFDIASQLIPKLCADGQKVGPYLLQGYWNPLDSFQEYQEAQKAILCSAKWKQSGFNGTPVFRHPFLDARKVKDGVWVGRNSRIHPQAVTHPPMLVGENCYIARGVEIGPDVVIGKNVLVDEGASIAHTTILDNTYVGQCVNLDRRIVNKDLLIDGKSGASIYVTDQHLLDKTYQAVDNSGISQFFDSLIAFLLLLLTLPLSLLICLLLLITQRKTFLLSPIAHAVTERGENQGQNKIKRFNLVRFCTRNVEGAVTGIGHWLERWGLHRIPELLNVVKGDIRLVGVKPLSPEEYSQVTESWQEKRYDAQPGFTGLWYVQSSSGDFNEILVADVYYVATRVWYSDGLLLFQSLLAWFRRLLEKGKR